MATTWNPSDKGTDIVLSNGNLTAALPSASAGEGVRSTNSPAKTSGKLYFEFTIDVLGTGEFTSVGIANPSANITVTPATDTNSIVIKPNISGGWFDMNSNGFTVTFTLASIAAGQVWSYAIDLGSGHVWARNVTLATGWTAFSAANLTGNPATDTDGWPTGMNVTGGAMMFFFSGDAANNIQVTINPGPTFTGTIPVGFSSWDPSAATGVPVWLYFGQSLALGASAKLARDLIRNPIRSRRRLLTGRDDR